MNVLSLDSCSAVATGAVLCDGVLRAEFVCNDSKTHSVKLLPQIEHMLHSVDLTFADINCIVCTTGPGSFTGQRIGVSTAKAMAHGLDIPVIGISALESLAYNLPRPDVLICPIMDARREQVYTGTYTFENGALRTIHGDRAMALSDLLAELHGQQVIFLGDGVPVFREIITQTLGNNASFAPPHLLHLRGGSVAQCGADKIKKNNGAGSYQELQPMYLRLSQAEREYNDRFGK